jgi:hypothetical protein
LRDGVNLKGKFLEIDRSARIFIPDGDQIISKTSMTRVEGENSRLRHYLARLHKFVQAFLGIDPFTDSSKI